jgi:hypothetical protein
MPIDKDAILQVGKRSSFYGFTLNRATCIVTSFAQNVAKLTFTDTVLDEWICERSIGRWKCFRTVGRVGRAQSTDGCTPYGHRRLVAGRRIKTDRPRIRRFRRMVNGKAGRHRRRQCTNEFVGVQVKPECIEYFLVILFSKFFAFF